MYPAPGGDRILEGAERRLYQESLAMMTDLLADGDMDFGVSKFDEMLRGPKLVALYESGRALLRPDETPERSAYLEAAIGAVYQHVLAMIEMEIDDPDSASDPLKWRTLVLDASMENGFETVPVVENEALDEWELAVECLAEVLWDRDFEIDAHLDADPEASSAMKLAMGIPDGYYTTVPLDPPDHQLQLYVDALMGLTPCGRGEFISPEDHPDEPTDGLF